MKKYPDMSELFARKEAARKKLAKLPIEEKMKIARRLNEAARFAPGYLQKEKPARSTWSLKSLGKKRGR